MTNEMVERIAEIPGEDGWWKSASQETYERLGEALLLAGFTEEEALDLLASAYWAVAACYGG